MIRGWFPGGFLGCLLIALLPGCAVAEADLSQIRLPPGFTINLFARVANARSLAVAPGLGVVFVGNRRGHSVWAAIDADRDGRAERVERFAQGLSVPNGVAWRDGYLYVAEQHRVIRYAVPDLAAIGKAEPEILLDGLPDKRHHGWRYLAFDPKGRLHVTLGAPCNICAPEGLEGSIIRLVPGGAPKIVARGVRNSVGMDFHPGNGRLYFTDNGADFMGDDLPPDELNMATREGLHYGYPFFGGGRARTSRFAESTPPPGAVFPVQDFNAHVAALGVHFYRGKMFPPAYRTDAFVAQHGSWNRSVPDGYRIMRLHLDAAGRVRGKQVFAEGWLRGSRVIGRPVDIKELPDGSLLVSDDFSDAVYRITWRK